jgi:hypothetical protein
MLPFLRIPFIRLVQVPSSTNVAEIQWRLVVAVDTGIRFCDLRRAKTNDCDLGVAVLRY